jgi:hypothetical protein
MFNGDKISIIELFLWLLAHVLGRGYFWGGCHWFLAHVPWGKILGSCGFQAQLLWEVKIIFWVVVLSFKLMFYGGKQQYVWWLL